MTVVINEFEVVPEPAPAPAESTAPANELPAPTAPAAPDVEHAVQHISERTLRVRAH